MTECRRLAALLSSSFFSAVLAPVALAAGVPVGDSSLIGTLQYSDTFTLTEHGGINGRDDGVYPVGTFGPDGLNIESNYGNPAMVWTDAKWSVNQDSSAFPATNTPYPGGSGAGSATGMTQTGIFGGGGVDFGIEYGLSNQYVVQFDAVQTADRIDITSSSARDTIFGGTELPGDRSLAVFFRAEDRPIHGDWGHIGIYNPIEGETDSGLAPSGIGVQVGQWANYAVRFDLANHEIEFYVNQVSLGVLDMTTFAGGIYDDWSNGAVSVGGFSFGESDILWTDNFQVGTPDTAPPLVPGDFDGDGNVNGIDFVAWQSNFPTALGAALEDGDADGDGDVDGADFVVWQTNFPFSAGPGAAPVPEPMSATLFALGGIVCLAYRTLRRRAPNG